MPIETTASNESSAWPIGNAAWLRAALGSAVGFLWTTLFWFEPARRS